AHDLGRHAYGGARQYARQRGLAARPGVVGGRDQRGRGAVDDGGGIAAGLHPAEGRADAGERVERRGAHVGVGGQLLGAAQLELARLVALALEPLVPDRGDLAREEARTLRRERTLEALRGKSIDLRPR